MKQKKWFGILAAVLALSLIHISAKDSWALPACGDQRVSCQTKLDHTVFSWMPSSSRRQQKKTAAQCAAVCQSVSYTHLKALSTWIAVIALA